MYRWRRLMADGTGESRILVVLRESRQSFDANCCVYGRDVLTPVVRTRSIATRKGRATARPGPGRVHALAARRAQLSVRADPLRSRHRPGVRHRRRGVPERAVGGSGRGDPAADAEIAFFLAGADPWEGDRLGRLALTKEGLQARDELVLDRLLATGAAVVVVLAGGYAPDIRDTVDINAATVAAVAARDGALS